MAEMTDKNKRETIKAQKAISKELLMLNKRTGLIPVRVTFEPMEWNGIVCGADYKEPVFCIGQMNVETMTIEEFRK
jgi:hypothetical protein